LPWPTATANRPRPGPACCATAHAAACAPRSWRWATEDREHAEQAIKAFAKLYGAKFPKAVKKITDDQDELPAFFDFPAEHWIHL
jgi:transposase-like protein